MPAVNRRWCLLGSPDFYGRFGFVAGRRLRIHAPDPAWGKYFQVRSAARSGRWSAGRSAMPRPSTGCTRVWSLRAADPAGLFPMSDIRVHILGCRCPVPCPLTRSWQAACRPSGRANRQGMTMSRDAASVTLVGRAGTHPQVSRVDRDRVSFRMVATERYFDKAANDWVDGDEFGVTVVCWRALATPVLTTVRKGDPDHRDRPDRHPPVREERRHPVLHRGQS